MKSDRNFSEITPYISELSNHCESFGAIDRSLFDKYNVKRGLRDENGKGVLTGLTDISDVRQVEIINGVEVPIAGQLFYRGVNVRDIISGCLAENRPGFEESTYLLLFGELPTKQQLSEFSQLLASGYGIRVVILENYLIKSIDKERNTSFNPHRQLPDPRGDYRALVRSAKSGQ